MVFFLGDKEMNNGSVNVRTRDNKIHGECSLETLIEKFNKFKETRTMAAEEDF